MHPNPYRNRYALIFVLSLLIHALIIALLLWGEAEQEKPQKKSVVVQLKHVEKVPPKDKIKKKIDDPLKRQSKKAEPKKAEPKKAEPKKAEPKKAEPKKAEPKKAEPKKAEPKKAEPKKAEPKKAEPKKAEPKKAEPKKAEPKKAEPKKAEPKKAEPKKAEPKKAEPKKAEPKKAEPKKAEPKKAEPKKAEPKKAEPKKAEPKKAEPKKTEPKQSSPEENEVLGIQQKKPIKRPSTMQILDERALSKLVVASKSLDRRFAKRNQSGERKKRELNYFQKQEFNETLRLAFSFIEKNIQTPKWDGKKYEGEIYFYTDKYGYIERINIKIPSGHDGLDQSMINALVNTKQLPMPADKATSEVMYLTRKILQYSDEDMIR